MYKNQLEISAIIINFAPLRKNVFYTRDGLPAHHTDRKYIDDEQKKSSFIYKIILLYCSI